MKKEITLAHMHHINELLIKGADKKQFNKNWEISIPSELDFWNKVRENPSLEKSNEFINNLFSSYRMEKLSSYKKIFDYTFSENIDLFSVFHDLRVKPSARFHKYPEYLDLINYVYQKNYYLPGHDFSPYFNAYDKPTKTSIASQVKLLPSLDSSEKSFDIYCTLFNDYLTLVPSIAVEEQKKIQSLFLKFKDCNFFNAKAEKHQRFYPSLLELEELSDYQEDNYFSKRFCFGADSRIVTLKTDIENSLTYIYNVVFNDLKEKELVQDFTTLLEQGYFYLYVFCDNQSKLDNVGRAVKSFHKEIQPYLQNNTESEDYYIKLFHTIFLAEKLSSKNSNENNKIIKPISNKNKI